MDQEDPRSAIKPYQSRFGKFLRQLILFLSILIAGGLGHAQETPSKNWIAIYIWDSFAPLTLDQSVPEMLISLEVIFHQHAMYSARREMFRKKDPYGNRSTEGHFMVWIHLDEELFQRFDLDRDFLPEKVYMFPDRETDIFTAWCGQANFRDFILDGVSGMGNKTIFNDGSISGELDVFQNAINQGDAEYGAGYYLEDDQAMKVLKAIMQYPGFEKGYSFVTRKENRPEQEGYEPALSQAVNGYNCNDFAFYLLENAGIFSKEETEALKADFWYPTYFWDHTIPLEGSGQRIYDAFSEDREKYMGRDEILKLAWTELFFSTLNIFDEKALKEWTEMEAREFRRVRVWDQVTMIEYLKDTNNRDFRAKFVLEELKPAVESNSVIQVPWPEVDQQFDFRKTKRYRRTQRKTLRKTRKKLRKAGLTNDKLLEYRELERKMKPADQ